MNKEISNQFHLNYLFFDDTHETELSIYVGDNNLLSFKRDGNTLTTRWNLEELALWLRSFLTGIKEDPYPVDVDGLYAAQKDINARDFDSEDEDEFDTYYDALDDWNTSHRWHTASSGAILADLYFQLVGDYVEISWNNQDCEEYVSFENELGGICVPKDLFISEIERFLHDYANHWEW